MTKLFTKTLLSLGLLALLTGCLFETNQTPIDQLINERFTKAQTEAKRSINNMPVIPTKIETAYEPYEGGKYPDPFMVEDDLTHILSSSQPGGVATSLPPLDTDPERPLGYTPDFLESYALAELNVIGTIGSGYNSKALIQIAGESALSTKMAGLGDHLGRNFGEIVQIVPDSYLKIREKFASDKNEEGWEVRERILYLEIK